MPTAIHDVFPVLKIKVSAEEALVSAVEYKYPGAKRQPAAYPIGASPFPSAPVTALAYTECVCLCLRLYVCMYVCVSVSAGCAGSAAFRGAEAAVLAAAHADGQPHDGMYVCMQVCIDIRINLSTVCS